MGSMCAQGCVLWVPCVAHFKWFKWGYSVLHKERLEPRVLPWQQHSRRQSVSFVMYIAGAKFEGHCFIIARVIHN